MKGHILLLERICLRGGWVTQQFPCPPPPSDFASSIVIGVQRTTNGKTTPPPGNPGGGVVTYFVLRIAVAGCSLSPIPYSLFPAVRPSTLSSAVTTSG